MKLIEVDQPQTLRVLMDSPFFRVVLEA